MFWVDRKTIIEITTKLPATCSDDAGLMVTFMLILLWYVSLKACYIADLLENFPTVSPLSFVSINFAQRMLVWVERHGPGTHTNTRRGRRMLYELIHYHIPRYADEMMKWWVSDVFFKLKAGETWAGWRYCSLCPGRLDSQQKWHWQKMRFSNKSVSWQVLYLAYSSWGSGSAAFLHTPILENICQTTIFFKICNWKELVLLVAIFNGEMNERCNGDVFQVYGRPSSFLNANSSWLRLIVWLPCIIKQPLSWKCFLLPILGIFRFQWWIFRFQKLDFRG